MIRRPPRSTLDRSSAASDVYKRQVVGVAAYFFILPKINLSKEVISQPEAQAETLDKIVAVKVEPCLLYTSPSPRDRTRSRMPSSA